MVLYTDWTYYDWATDSKERSYVGLLQLSIFLWWLENHHQVTAQGDCQIISYMVRVPRYVTHLLQKEQCSVCGGFTVYPPKCNISAKYSMSVTMHWIQNTFVLKRFPPGRTRPSIFYLEYQKDAPRLSYSFFRGEGGETHVPTSKHLSTVLRIFLGHRMP